MKYFRTAIALVVATALVVSCSDSLTDPNKSPKERGDIKKVELIENYTAETIQQFVAQYNFDSSIEFTFDVSVYKVIYYSIDTNGDITEASGALMVPEEASASPLFSLQHGTVFKRDRVASQGINNALEGFLGVAFASAEYVTILPDYLGFGVSETMHPYIHSKGNANVVVDFIRAAKSWCADNEVPLNEQLFLAGYSEGGYVTMAAQKLIEAEYASELPLTAVAPAAGPFDLSGFVDRIIEDLRYPDLANAGFLLTAYNDIYGWNMLGDIFQEPYAAQMPTLFDGSKESGEITEILPDSLQNLLNPQFVQDYRNGNLSEVKSAFEENTLLDWTPQTPMHLFHGTADQVVDVQNSMCRVFAAISGPYCNSRAVCSPSMRIIAS